MIIRKVAIKIVQEYYQEAIWSSVSSILDHVVLWWSPEALASRHSHGSELLKDWLHRFIEGNDSNSNLYLYIVFVLNAITLIINKN